MDNPTRRSRFARHDEAGEQRGDDHAHMIPSTPAPLDRTRMNCVVLSPEGAIACPLRGIRLPGNAIVTRTNARGGCPHTSPAGELFLKSGHLRGY